MTALNSLLSKLRGGAVHAEFMNPGPGDNPTVISSGYPAVKYALVCA
jgi:hypothetical protein